MTLSVSHGTLSGVTATGSLTVSGTGTAASPLVLSATTITALNTGLQNLVYTPTNGYNGPDALGILDVDTTGNPNLPAQPVTVAIFVGPTITAPPSVPQVAINNRLPIAGISVADPSNTVTVEQMTLSVSHGTLSGVTADRQLDGVSGTGTAASPLVLTATTITALNTGLQTWSIRPPTTSPVMRP